MNPKKKPQAENIEEVLATAGSIPDAGRPDGSDQIEELHQEPKPITPQLCGHVNRHHFGPDGQPLELVCDLEPHKTGDHHARYQKNIADPVMDEKGRVIKVNYHLEEADAWWGDAAGKPVADILEGDQVQMTLHQKDMVMEILSKDPRMTAQEAVARAKAMSEWNVPTAAS